jgi:hypothetical protein
MNGLPQTILNPDAPTLYLGFSGVLHIGEGVVTSEGKVALDSGRKMFEFTPLLMGALADYPAVQVVLTTQWCGAIGDERVISLLPKGLRERVVDTTRRFPPRFREVVEGTGKAGSVGRHARANGITNWLAMGDDLSSASGEGHCRFLPVPRDTGLATSVALELLRMWLCENAKLDATDRREK